MQLTRLHVILATEVLKVQPALVAEKIKKCLSSEVQGKVYTGMPKKLARQQVNQ